jgi:hypothetical protein
MEERELGKIMGEHLILGVEKASRLLLLSLLVRTIWR